ncbi:MFS transporter, partial [Enterococcus faecalis]|uniref:MFS transporter n=2 Tax=Bacteria TaxID=2 RepID=UPI00403FB4DD
DGAAGKVAEIRATFREDHRPRLGDVLGGSFLFRPIVWAGILLATFQQFVGINVIFYYGETLWKLAGVDESAALQRNIVSGAVSIGACLAAI